MQLRSVRALPKVKQAHEYIWWLAANLGTAMLQKSGFRDVQEDLKYVGKIILECLEPATFLKKESSLKSKSWESDVVGFVESTKCKSAQFLLQVS